jgi:hypothetical protein
MGQEKRVAIVGTAPSWVQTPWNDPSIEVWLLNDCYNSGNIPRADAWFDLHPFDQMYFRPQGGSRFIDAREVPDGKHYIRPHGHLEKLQEMASHIPVFVQKVPEGWPPNAREFPMEAVMEFMRARPDQRAYIASSPAMEVALAIIGGYTEIHIYGIHLATEQEYREQRPNFEWLLGRAVERGIKLVLPEECPLLKHSHVYAYESRPAPIAAEAQKKLHGYMKEQQKLTQQLVEWPRFKSKDKPLARMRELSALILDAQQQIKRAQVYAA